MKRTQFVPLTITSRFDESAEGEHASPAHHSSCRTKMLLSTLLLTTVLPIACDHPLRTETDRSLQSSLSSVAERELAGHPRREIRLSRAESRVSDEFAQDQMEQINAMAGPGSYEPSHAMPGEDLTGLPFHTVEMSLYEAISTAVMNNLDAQIAGFEPAMSEAQVTAAEAQFDSVVSAGIDFSKTDQPQPTSIFSGLPMGSGASVNEATTYSASIGKKLITGGQVSLGTALMRSDNSTPGQQLDPNPAHSASVELGVVQPLLRGFGSTVNLSQVRLNRNAHRSTIEEYRSRLLDTVFSTEQTYWSLVLARHALNIQERLLERGIETEKKVRGRVGYDATPADMAEAVSRVQTRKTQVTQTRNDVLLLSDQLKQMINAPGLPVGSETVVIPTEALIDDPISYNYVDSIRTALEHRPEIQQALLSVDDSSIRQMLADNLRLPRLDVSATVRWNGMDSETSEAYGGLTDDDFVDYLVGAFLEFPIGNREAQANYRSARLQRQQSVIVYRRVVQGVVAQVKEALRAVNINYELLQNARESRLAAAESLRAHIAQEKYLTAMTPDFLNLKFNRQEALASAEYQEYQALVNYQVALSGLYQAMGVGLERNRIEFLVPDHAGVDFSSY